LEDGARLFVEEVGPAKARRGAVFLHGSALRTDAWYYQLEGIGEHRLVFYDLRGHGVSQPRGEKDFTIKTLAEDLLEVIEACDLDEVVLVGHSVGGMIALDLCGHRPELMGSLIQGLVLSNTTYRPAVETLAGGAAIAHLERLTRRPFDGLGTHHHRLDRLRRIIKPSDAIFMMVSFAAFGPRASAKQIDFTYDMLAETPTDIIFDLIKSYRQFDVRDLLQDITVPALVIGAEHDRLTVSDASRHLAEQLPKAELVMLEDCGHMTMLERHHEFNVMLERFLNDHLGRPGR
jgi:pimeloyl-ACP methyl ester carboxylesterase